MKFLKHFKFRKICVISAIVIGVGGLLFALISTWMIDEPEPEPEMETSEQKPAVLEVPGRSTIQSPKPPSEADIEAAITALENLDVTENRDASVESAGDEVSPETQVTDSSDKIPLSYEEELRQRFLRVRETPEYKAYLDKYHELMMEHYEIAKREKPATTAMLAFTKNPYSIFGYTKAEGSKMEWSDEEYEIIRQEKRRLDQEWKKERDERKAEYRANQYARDGLRQHKLKLLGMTQEEYYIATGTAPPPPPPSKLTKF